MYGYDSSMCNVRLNNYVSYISRKGYQKVADAIKAGESNPKVLVSLSCKLTLYKHGRQAIEDSLNGFVTDADRDIFRQYCEEHSQMERYKLEK